MTMRYVLANLKSKNSSVSNPAQCEILVMLSENDGSAVQKDIETALGLRKSTVSGILDTMIRNGLVEKTDSKTDLRSKVISLTEKGWQEYKVAMEETSEMEQKLSQGISDRDLETFFKVMDQVKENISK